MAAPQKYIRLKNRDGRIIDWHPELHLTEEMEVFESDVPPPEKIASVVDYLVSLQSAKVTRAVRQKE